MGFGLQHLSVRLQGLIRRGRAGSCWARQTARRAEREFLPILQLLVLVVWLIGAPKVSHIEVWGTPDELWSLPAGSRRRLRSLRCWSSSGERRELAVKLSRTASHGGLGRPWQAASFRGEDAERQSGGHTAADVVAAVVGWFV